MYSIMNWHYIHYEIINTVSLKGKPLHRTSYVIFKRPVWNENVSLKAVNTELFPLFLGLSQQVMAIYFICYVYMHVCTLSCFSYVWLFVTPWTVLPGSSVHGILQARIWEWVAISFCRGSSQPKDWTRVSHVSCIAGQCFTTGATWEAPF